jgi:hypothetical protein
MRLVLIIVVILAVAGSLVADYKWRRWMAARRRGGDDADPSRPR